MDEGRFLDAAAREKQAERGELLRNPPWVAAWVAHNDPPWLAANTDLGDVNAVRQNISIDQELQATFERLDRTRPALAASGDIDQQVLHVWETGAWRGLTDAQPLLVTGFGAHTLPAGA